ncbi:hypothetical protein EV401DRAFT_2073216 [Pisolithus croceorrhizus]|nr:hypothetical protein EV401DRAFT_2073216 [Pisolithus croceorrhizus]
MPPARSKRSRCARKPPYSGGNGATQPNSGSPSDNGGVCDASATETIRPGTSPSYRHVGVPVLAPTGDLPTGPGILTPAFADVQPMAAQCPEGSVDVFALAHVKEVPLGKRFTTDEYNQINNINN